MEPHERRRVARELVDRITADLKELRAAGVEITGVGVGAGDRVRVQLRRLDPAWIELIRSRHGDDLDFDQGDYATLA
jgi:hypothetical protein